MLYKIMFEKGFDVLNDYRGYAALMWLDVDEPNVLYCYHGASRTYVNSPLYIERPLHYFSNSRGTFFSSEPEPLRAIIQNKKTADGKVKEPISLIHNKVVRLDYSKGDKVDITYIYDVHREDNNVGINNKTYASSYTSYPKGTVQRDFQNANTKNSNTGKGSANGSNSQTLDKEFFTPEDVKDKHEFVSFLNGYCFVTNKLSCKKLNGIFRVTEFGTIAKIRDISTPEYSIYYFYKGVMIAGHEQYQELMRNKKLIRRLSNKTKFAKLISRYSQYPVMVLSTQTSLPEEVGRWYWRGAIHPYLDFSPLFTANNYEIRDGEATDRSIKVNQKFNSGKITEVVFTNPEREVEEVQLDIDWIAYDVVYDNLKDFIMSVTENELIFLILYVREVYFQSLPVQEDVLQSKLVLLIQTACQKAETIRFGIEQPIATFEDYVELVGKEFIKNELSPVDDDDEDDVEDVESQDIPDASKAVVKYEGKEENTESMAYTKEDELYEALEDMTATIKDLSTTIKTLEKIDHNTATELAVILERYQKNLVDAVCVFLSDKGLKEARTDLLAAYAGMEVDALVD